MYKPIARVDQIWVDVDNIAFSSSLFSDKVDNTDGLNQLQQIQNSLARAVVKAPKYSHIKFTPILKSLHWLNNERIEYKLLSLTYKVFTTSQPILTILYLFNPLAVPAPHRLSPFLAHQPSPH